MINDRHIKILYRSNYGCVLNFFKQVSTANMFFSQNNAVQVICEWSGAGVTTMSSRYSTQCYSKCEIIIQSNLEFGICQKRYWNPHDLINHWRYLTILGDTWRYLTCIPFSFLLFPLFFSSASVSITGIAPPGGLLSTAPKPWDQVAQVDCLSGWFCTYLILKMPLTWNFDWMHSCINHGITFKPKKRVQKLRDNNRTFVCRC